jgi:hypothetical protein
MLSAAIIAPAIAIVVLVVVRNLALENSYTLGGLFQISTALRASVFGMCVILAGGAYALWAFSRVKGGAVLEVSESAITYHRPGAPWTGWFAEDLRIDPESVDRVEVSRQRHITLERIELAVESGRERIVVNLGHARGPDLEPSTKLLDRNKWLEQPLVQVLEELTGKEATRG